VAIQTSSSGSKPPIQNQNRQVGISMEETKISDQNDFVTGVAIQNSKGWSRTPRRNHTPCATNWEKKPVFTPYQTKNHISIPDQDETKTNPSMADDPQKEKENYL